MSERTAEVGTEIYNYHLKSVGPVLHMVAAIILAAGIAACSDDEAAIGADGSDGDASDFAESLIGGGDEELVYGFTAYPGAEVKMNVSMGPDGQAAMATDATVEQVMTYYRDNAADKGFTPAGDADEQDGYAAQTFKRGSDRFAVMVNGRGEGPTQIHLGWSQHQ